MPALDSEDRIEYIESTLSEHTRLLLPAIARIDEALTGMKSDIGELKDDVRCLKNDSAFLKTQGLVQDQRLKVLEDDYRDRAGQRKDTRTWVLGIVGSVIVAVLLLTLGIKP